jgi:ethanolamine utilization protein EutA
VKAERLLSVGIDIGTTTMSLAVSAVTIGNTVRGIEIPRVKILSKEVLFRSTPCYTPFFPTGDIDQERVEGYLAGQCAAAGVSPDQIATGAVIVTGRAAEARNAEAVGQAISRISGVFVVATAGAHLEAALSGRGAGMAQYSKEHHCRVLNLDIGGGTTNAALFDDGVLARTFCFNIGGRVVQFAPNSTRIAQYTEHGEQVAAHAGVSLAIGRELGPSDMGRLSDHLAEALTSFVQGRADALARVLAIDTDMDRPVGPVDAVSFSGGVGRLFYEDARGETQLLQYDDLGPSLAQHLRRKASVEHIPVVQPEETLFATVIGAGIHTVNISGSTIYLSNVEDLPLRDNPVVSLGDMGAPDWKDTMRGKLRSFSETTGLLPVLFSGKIGAIGFSAVRSIADRIAEITNEFDLRGPLIVVCEDDVGKILGGLLRNRVASGRSIVSIDQLFAEELDYMDIGKPLYGGTVVPVVVKTLIFSN